MAADGSRIRQMFLPPILTPARVRAAYVVAVGLDVVQWLLGPIGWAFPDEILDVVAMAAISSLIGFHPLLLPTFALEFLPLADLLPTWTACVALVVLIRKKQQGGDPPPPCPGPVIDV
jgi:hypothetical protein